MTRLLSMRTAWGFVFCAVLCALPVRGQNAKTLRAQAETEPNQEKQVALLCKAADMEPGNAEYRKDCDISKSALIAADKQALKTAQDAADGGQSAKAKRYAKYVSSLDPELHRQAEQLLAKLNAPDSGTPAAAQSQSQTQARGPSQADLLAQAATAYQSGNLSAARSAAQSVTDPALKPAASQMLGDIDRYSGLVAAGQRHEQAKEYADAARSYQLARDLNPSVAADDLAGRAQRMLQAAAAASHPGATAVATVTPPKGPPTAARQATVEPSPEEKKKRLLDEGLAAMARNDLDTAGRRFKLVLDADPSNADAKHGLEQITAALSKDPVLLEKTLREAIVAFYASNFEAAESRFNRYLGAEGGKKKGAAYFYLGATEVTLAMLNDASKRASRTREAQEDFKQARLAGYQPIDRYVSARVLGVWNGGGL